MVARVASLLVAQGVAQAAESSAESLDGVSLLQTQAHVHVHVHGHANETDYDARGVCGDDKINDASSTCWPGYTFADFVPPGCLSQGQVPGEFPGAKKWFGSSWVVGKCDRLVTPSRVAAFNKALSKFGGCQTGYPEAKTWQQPISYKLSHKIDASSSDEERAAVVAECIQLAETDKRCAGANMVSMPAGSGSCYCWGGVTLLDRRDSTMSCLVKSLPAEQNPRQYDCNTRKDCIYSIKETKEASSCSKGWWVMAGGWPNPKPSGMPFGLKDSGFLDQINWMYGKLQGGWNPASHKAYRQPPGFYASGQGIRVTDLAGNGNPSDCAKAVQQCIEQEKDYCKDPLTGEWPKGAVMIAASSMSQTECKAWWGDISQGTGAVIGEEAPEGALYNQQASWICLTDDEDPESGVVLMEGSKKSGKYRPGGPKKPTEPSDEDDDAEPLTKEEKAQCKTDKKALREAQKLKREYKKAFKSAREVFRASKEKLIAQRNLVKELKAKLAKC